MTKDETKTEQTRKLITYLKLQDYIRLYTVY